MLLYNLYTAMTIFTELSVIILIATLAAGLMRVLKQPLILGYILTGIIIGPSLLNIFNNAETLEVFSQIGISILLFIVGISLSPKVIKEVGKISLVTGLGQIVFTSVLGFLIALAFGFSKIESIYIAIALTFSSTIIILKLLSDKKDLEKLYGKIAIGFLLVQDLAATLILIVVSSFAGAGESGAISTALITLAKGFVITAVMMYISSKVLPKLSDFFANSAEFLFLFSLGWGMGIAALFSFLGFSIEVGALIAGATFATSPYAQEISSKLKPLRDFFIIMFFILLGSRLALDSLGELILPAFFLSVFVLFGNPLIVMVLMGLFGYNKRTGFMAGLTVAQISEFSLILILLGIKIGHLDNTILSLVTVVGLITIAGSTYMIMYSDKIYPKLAPYLSIFERKKTVSEVTSLSNYKVILFGCNRVGFDFIKTFASKGQEFLAIDFDPKVIKQLNKDGVNCIYGDAEDAEFLEDLRMEYTELVISTIPDFDTNKFILAHAKKANADVTAMVISYSIEEARQLYDLGASFVILPHFISGQYAARLAESCKDPANCELKNEKEQQIKYLEERMRLGHAHPNWHHAQ